MMTSASVLDGLKHERPEWASWLGVIDEIVRESAAHSFDAAVPGVVDTRPAAAPLLAGVTVSVSASSIRRSWHRLIRLAARGGTAKMTTLEGALDAQLDVLTLFAASVCQDTTGIKTFADTCGADAEAFQAVAALLPVPFLQACNRQLASTVPSRWVEGYCPVCASWPAFAEVRGIERRRYFRCGRCGAEWHAQALACPYCSMADHNELVALVPGKSGAQAVIDACKRCRGYVKTFARLQGCAPGVVIVEDLASVALDMAAFQEGYTRPSEAAYPLGITATEPRTTRRFFTWNA